ncbi:MAG: ThiF family adenylyltransferase [Magnetococcus sp. YQC-5]
MAKAYHDLVDVAEVSDANDLTISRARALFGAVCNHRDYTLIQMLRSPIEGRPTHEHLVVDVQSDQIPSRNPVGIQYLERLALRVPVDDKALIEVLALRKDFPVLLHQNRGNPGTPASLCLYFEPSVAVMRTWTPQAFLRRIQWWLESSAQSTLHPADQPVEQLFFTSKYELVLPWNLDDLRENPEVSLTVFAGTKRPDESFTCFLMPVARKYQGFKTVKHIDLRLPPIDHGLIERDPETLGQLADLLAARSVDMIGTLQTALRDGIGQKGAPGSSHEEDTVILLHVPIRRSANDEPDTIQCRAFLAQVGPLELGVACGALMKHENQYFKDLMNTQPATAWRGHTILPMEVLRQNDVALMRHQSGILAEGPTAVLIGAGSLGSALLKLWGRSGWGTWTVIDKDHIKPHNLSRHEAFAQHIGQSKATVAAVLHDAAVEGATRVRPIVADAYKAIHAGEVSAFTDASLVVDASTTLEYPRASSGIDELPRHMSVFVTPNGDAAVLLAEDSQRRYRLRTLEAQYYRALIQEDWGTTHLDGYGNTFWSGASCRDISLVMPYSRVLVQASTLAEQIQIAAEGQDAIIRIWHRNPANGIVDVHDIPVVPEQCIVLGEIMLYFDDGVVQNLQAQRQRGLPNETGGVLLGYYDFNIQAVVVVAGLPAPPDSQSSPALFERGISGLSEKVNDASTRTAGMVGYIGEWHSHPPGHSAAPSHADRVQLDFLARKMAEDGLPAIQLIVGENDLQIIQLNSVVNI